MSPLRHLVLAAETAWLGMEAEILVKTTALKAANCIILMASMLMVVK